MKALLAFGVLLLSASCMLELSGDISEEEFAELYNALSEGPSENEMVRGDWEVSGSPGVIHAPKKGPVGDRYKHVKDIMIQKGIASFKAAVSLIKSGLGYSSGYGSSSRGSRVSHDNGWVCSYAFIKRAGYGHTVWCSKREKFGHHTRLWDYRAGAFFSGGIMVAP